jgi:formylglycine-generating enzyme required for sulfatase activity
VLLLWSECTHAQIAILDTECLRNGVVRITAAPPGQNQKVGTGFIVRLEKDLAYIVTAAHVVSGDAQPRVQFFTQEDVSVQATVRHSEGDDEVTGLALLVVRGKDNLPSGLTVLTLASASRLSGNEEIVVIGPPRGAGDWAILKGGIASRQGRYMTIDANIDEGNSGGPIIHSGEVVGLIGGVTRYGRGVTAGSVREYLEGHGIDTRAAPPAAVARVQPIPSIPTKPEKSHPAFDREITGKDGSPMVLIPAGEFLMGSPDGEGDKDEHPQRQVSLDAFYMDKFEVTVVRYAEFFQSTKRSKPLYWDQEDINKHRNLPVIGVDWNDAEAYCRWAGKRLPTEAEWEKAARGTDRRTYPWGNEQPTSRLANFGKKSTKNLPFSRLAPMEGYEAKSFGKKTFGEKSTQNAYEEFLAPVEGYEAGNSPYGLHHMAGNVWEWTDDWYDDQYYKNIPGNNPRGPSNGDFRVIRGGSWSTDPAYVRSASRNRNTPTARLVTIGFRCAQDSQK